MGDRNSRTPTFVRTIHGAPATATFRSDGHVGEIAIADPP